MEYTHIYPNQRQTQQQPQHNNTLYQHDAYIQPALYSAPQQFTLPDQQQQQATLAYNNLYQQWQQQHAVYQPTNNTPRYSHSPQDTPSGRASASLSPPSYMSDSHLSPSPISSNADTSLWPDSANQTRTRWITPETVSPVWPPSGEFTFTQANGQPSPNGPPSTNSNTNGTPENEQWAIMTERQKKQRTGADEKSKVGACKHCKRLKMKCTFEPPTAAACQRCRGSGQDCIVEGRKPRKNSEPLEQLSAQIEDKEEIIQGLLKVISPSSDKPPDSAEVWRWIERGARSLMSPNQTGEALDVDADDEEKERLPADSAPLGFLADLSLNDRSGDDGEGKSTGREGRSTGETGDGEVGVANAEYFKPGPMAHPELRRIIVERQMVPEILTLGVVTEEEVEHLFRIFHERIDAVIAIIDPTIHTVAGVKARCPFLFTVICAIASRYWIERPELYSVLMHHARSAAATAITDGWKSLEVCQAYLLLSVYPQPARSWAEDRAWLYLGCAIRLAMDLNLYKQGSRTFVNEAHEREVLNRTRTWLICFNMDRALATKLGRPTTIPEDYVVRHSREWWRRSRYNGRLDVHMCFYTQLLRTVTRYFSLIYSDPESFSGFNESTEFGPITRAFDDEMEQFKQDAEHSYSTALEPNHPACLYRLALMPLAVAYYRLVMYSFGLEHAHRSSLEPGNMFLARSIETACEVLRITNEELPIYEFHRYSPDGHWMWSVFAAAFLIKLAMPRSTQPTHLVMTAPQQETAMLLVQKFITTLEHSAVDNRHTPALYARYLKKVLGEPYSVKSPDRSSSQPRSPQASSPNVLTQTTIAPKSSNLSQEEDVLAAMYSLSGDFWDNALLPGTWGIAGSPTPMRSS